jgi:alkanesulfonate monooxygenase SsuD/methylene tetrahydromethanopterin reductase-like flavin-dependent oxidoreductase (luciferase family)
MRTLWRDEVASFRGDYVHFPPTWSWPKPAQPGGPPILLGGAAGPKLFDHIAEYGDGWIPIGGAGVKDALPALHAACAARDRDPAGLRVVPFGTTMGRDKLDYYATLGIDEVVLRVPGAARDEVVAVLDRYAGFVDAA